MEHEDDFDIQDSCPADSESEKFSEFEDSKSSKSKGKDSKDGWSFEMDEEDVFDSEMNKEGNEEVRTISGTNVRNVSVEDLNDALIDETEDSEGEGVGVRRRQRETVSDTEEEFKECRKEQVAASGSCLSSSCPDTTSASESSVSNSPNPRQTAKKGKKGKKKKR